MPTPWELKDARGKRSQRSQRCRFAADKADYIEPNRSRIMQVRLSPRFAFSEPAPSRAPDGFFLPDLCDLRVTLALVLSVQLLAFGLTLAMPPEDFWLRLSRVSIYAQGVALSSAGLLCGLRARLAQLALPLASALILVLVLGLAIGTALLGRFLFRDPGDMGGISDHLAPTLRLGFIATLVAALALRYLYLQHILAQRMRDEFMLRIDALQARIRPHFLFNSLNTITALIRSQPSLAEAALEDLADLFRASLAASGSFVTLEEELTLCRHYLHLESLRLGSRLRVDWRVDDLPKQALLPALTLQPLLENAIYHGIETCAEGGTLQVHGHLNKDLIKISLRNPQDGPSRPGHGLAIANTRQRLGLSFGPAGRLELHQTPTTFEVILAFPLLTGVPDGARPAAL
jgi:two-component system sensor histidine kinase AlgZ